MYAHPSLAIIIPANNEERYIAGCLDSIAAQTNYPKGILVIVAANACTDDTVPLALAYKPQLEDQGIKLICLDIQQPGKINALNTAERDVPKDVSRVYLDADVRCDSELIGQLKTALDSEHAVYATGTLAVMPAKSWITRQYARLWQKLPFVQSGAVGAGLFSVNPVGRARWDTFPDIISDDTFVRLQFDAQERKEVSARYHWPMVEGLRQLIAVRSRQDEGVAEISDKYPDMITNENKPKLGLGGVLKLALRDPIGFLVYATVHVMVRFAPQNGKWTRGR